MKLQPESKKELTRIACGTAICTAVMWVIFAALHLVGWVKFDYTVVLGSLIGAAVAIGLPLFFLTKDSAGTTTAALCMVLAMLPMFLLAMYEKNGQPLEVIIRQFVEVKFLRPKERPYQTNNFYTALARQERLDKEVRAIVKGKGKDPKQKA